MGAPRAYKPRHYQPGLTPLRDLFFAEVLTGAAQGKLWKRGFRHAEDLDLVPDKMLLSVPYVTARSLRKIRNWKNLVAEARRLNRIP